MRIIEYNKASFIRHQIRPFYWHLFGLSVICVLWALDLSFRPYLIKMMLDRMTASLPAEVPAAIGTLAVVYVAVSFFMAGTFRIWQLICRDMVPKLKANIVNELGRNLLDQSHTFYQNNFAGSLSNKVNDVSLGVAQVVLITMDSFVGNVLALIVASGLLLWVNPLLAFIFIAWMILFLWGSWHYAKQAHSLSDKTSELRSKMTGTLVDILSNMSAVRFFGNQRLEQSRIRENTHGIMTAERAFEWVLFKLFSFQGVSFAIMQSITLWVLVVLRSHNLITIGDFALSLTINIYIVDNLWTIGERFTEFSEQLGKISQGLRLTMDRPQLEDAPNAPPLKIEGGSIRFDHVVFSYGEKDQPLFADLDITIPAGKKLGLVGYSGSGKTSFVNLILRLFDVDEGAILIDGQNIAEVQQNSLRNAISFIPQDPTLFHRSILENISYAKPEATRDEIIAAAKAAHADEFISALPAGYDSMVGERGIKLSGGQRQRIAIARAILKNAPILILDEATSALDSVTEELIQDSLSALMQHRTTLVVAHRLSTLLHMDEIVVFHQGSILEMGRHEALLQQQGAYARLWESQVGGFLPD